MGYLSIKTSLQLAIMVILCGFGAPNVLASWVEATGSSPIINGNIEGARQKAMENALKQATLQSGIHIKWQQSQRNGQADTNNFDIAGSANVQHASVVREWKEDNLLKLLVRANIQQKLECATDVANTYRKTLLVSGFSLQNPLSSMVGNIINADRALASYLSKQLNSGGSLLVFESSQYRLYDELINAPTSETSQRTLTKAVSAAKDMGVQFVLSGVIRDLSMHDPSAIDSSWINSFKRTLGFKSDKRTFALELFIHDGFSGAIVFQKNYRLDEKWDLDLNESAPFGSPAFWNSQYGASVGNLLDDISWELAETLRCQPFMTRISKVDGKNLHFSSGANTGMRPGDELSVYRTYSFYDAEILQYTELTDVKTTLKIDQVQPHFGRGKIMVDAGRLNIQEDDVLVAW